MDAGAGAHYSRIEPSGTRSKARPDFTRLMRLGRSGAWCEMRMPCSCYNEIHKQSLAVASSYTKYSISKLNISAEQFSKPG